MHKTRVGKLTYLAYFLIKLYHSYYRLRSYAYKYSLRSRDIVKRQTGSYVAKKKKHGRSFLSKQARKISMRGSVVLTGINISAHVRRVYKRRRSTYKKRAHTGKNRYFDNSILQKKPKHVYLKYNTLYLKRKSKARSHEKNSTRTRATWSFYMLRRKQGAEVTSIINRVNIKARRVSHKKNFRRVRTLFLPAGRGARYNRMRKRSWFNFIRRFFRINAYFRFSLCPNFYLRGLRKKRNSNRYIDATQASRILNSFIISRNVTRYTLAWTRLYVFLYINMLCKLSFLYSKITHYFSLISSCISSLESVSLSLSIFDLRCYTNRHCTFLSFFSSLVYSTTLPLLKNIYYAMFFTGLSPLYDLRNTLTCSTFICMYMVSAAVLARMEILSVFSISLLQFFFLEFCFSYFSFNISSFLVAYLKSSFFFLLHQYVSGFFPNDECKYIHIPLTFLKKSNKKSFQYKFVHAHCIRSVRDSIKRLKLIRLISRSGYLSCLSRRFFIKYRKNYRNSPFMLLILRLCNLFIARSFLPATLEQHIMGTDSVVGSVKRFSSRKDILSDTEAFLNVSNDLKDALFKALRRNKWILRFFPAFKGFRILKYLSALFKRTLSRRVSFRYVRERIWYLVNQHSRKKQRYAYNARSYRRMIRRIRIKNVFTGYYEHARFFSLSYFLSTHYNMTIPDLVFFCKSTCLFSGSIASIFFLIERTVPVFLSNHFFISNSCGIRVNNVTQEQMSGNSFNFLAIGDIIEFDLVRNCTYTSIFAPLFVILFNIMLTCSSLFFRSRLLYVILSKLILYIFKSKRILKALSKKHIPVVRSSLLGTRAGVSYNSVSYFIRSRATSHTHMIYALSLGKRLGVRDISKRGLFAFFPFVQTVVSTNKAFVTAFLEFDGMNGFWILPDACLLTVRNDLVRCRVLAHWTCYVVFTRHLFNDSYFAGSIMFENYSIRKRFKYLLPVYLYTNFTIFVLNTQFFTKPDAFLYSKRYFTFYGTAMLAYKRIVEMANSDTSLVTRCTSLLHNVKRIQKNIRKNVLHNSVFSMHRSRIAHNRLFYRLNNIFRSNVKRLARRRNRNRHHWKRRLLQRTIFPVYLRTSIQSLNKSYARYIKYAMHSVIPSSAKRTSLNVLYDNNYSNNDTTRDYYVRFNKTHFVKSRFFGESSFTTGSASFKEPHFFPGVSRTDLTGGRVCSSFSFIFSKNVIANSTALSNNTLSLLYRLDQGRFANYSSLLKRRTKKYNYRSARVRPRYKRLQRKRPTPTYLSRYKRRRKHGITSMYKFAELSLGNNLRYIWHTFRRIGRRLRRRKYMSIKNKMHHDVRNAIDRRVSFLECINHKSDRQIAFGLLRSQQRIKSILSNHSVEEAVSDATIAAATQESTKAFYSSFLEKTHMAIIQYKLLQEEKRIEIRNFLGQGTRVLAKSLKHFLRGKIYNRIVPRSNRRGSRYRRRNSLRNRRRNRRRRRSFVERRNHYIRKRLRNPYLLWSDTQQNFKNVRTRRPYHGYAFTREERSLFQYAVTVERQYLDSWHWRRNTRSRKLKFRAQASNTIWRRYFRRRRRFFGNSFVRTRRKVPSRNRSHKRNRRKRLTRHRSTYSRHYRSNVRWRIKRAFFKEKRKSALFLHLFDNEEEAVRILHARRVYAVDKLSEFRVLHFKQGSLRSILASALLGRYLRERFFIKKALSRKKKIAINISNTNISSIAYMYTSSAFIGYQLRLNAVRRKDSKYTRIFRTKYIKRAVNNFLTNKRWRVIKKKNDFLWDLKVKVALTNRRMVYIRSFIPSKQKLRKRANIK